VKPAMPGPEEGVVLLVSEEAGTSRLLTRILGEEGFTVRAASDRDQAWLILDGESVDLVVADADVTGLAPEDFILRLRATPRFRRIPTIVVASRLTHGLLDSLTDAGAADFIQKPVQADEFVGRVLGVLRAARRGSDLEQLALVPREVREADLADLEEVAPEIVAAIPAGLLVIDREFRIRFANRAFLRFRGQSEREFVGEHLRDALLPGLVADPDALDAVERALRLGRPQTLPSLRFRTPAGEVRVEDLLVTPFEIAGEAHALIIMHDVSEHWFGEEAMRREKRKLEEIVDGMGASLAVLDSELHVVWANRTFHTWFGELWGKRFDLALRGLVLVGDTDPSRIFTEPEHVSKEWAHYTSAGDKRYYRNVILPTHDATGRLKELLLVTQDLTVVTLRAEQHRLLQDLATLMQSTLDLDRLLYIILTCATAGHALGFNRAFIFLVDRARDTLTGRMGVGPSSQDEAFAIWADIAGSKKSLSDLTSDYQKFLSAERQPLTQVVRNLSYPLRDEGAVAEVLARTVIESGVQVVRDAGSDPRVTEEFADLFGAKEFVSVPLQSKGRVVGVLLADNVFSARTISADQLETLELFASPAGLAVDNARTYAELKLSMDKLKDAQDALIHSERLATVGRLAAHVAHEIRNPLVTIGGFANSIIRRPAEVERVRKSAEIISEEVRRLEQILGGVMDFTRPARLVPTEGQLNELVARLVENMAAEFEEAEVAVSLDLDPDLPRCSFDEKQMHQVLLNLLRNAVESMCTPGREPEARRLVIRTRAEDENLALDVSDTGVGIDGDLLPHIFEPFSSTKALGTGLGLAVVKKILWDHGGDVTVSSEAGKWASFRLTLPREPVSPPHLGTGAEAAAGNVEDLGLKDHSG